MNWNLIRRCVILLLILAFGTACSRDPIAKRQKFMASGKRFAEQGKDREAAIQYLNAIRVDPNYAEAHYELAMAALKLGDFGSGLQELRKTVLLDSNNIDAQADLGKLLLSSGDIKAAQEKADLVLAKSPNHTGALLVQGEILVAQGKFDEALELIERAVTLNPSKDEAYLTLAGVQVVTRKFAAAEESYKTVLQMSPNNMLALLGLGDLYRFQHRWAEAEAYFQKAMQAQTKSLHPRAALIMLHLAQQQPDKAEKLARETKDEFPDNPEAYRILGNYYMQIGDMQRAAAEYGELYKAHPKDMRVVKNYTQLLILQDRVDEAAALNDELLGVWTGDPDGLVQRAQILIRRGKPKEAVTALKTALRYQPNLALGHYHLGVAMNMLGDLAGAERAWQEAARLRPASPEPTLALAHLALRRNDIQLLDRASERMMLLEPRSASGLVMRAAAAFARKQAAKGEADLRKAMQVEPRNPLPYTRLAEWKSSQGQNAEALTLFEQALERDPNSIEALHGVVGIYVLRNDAAGAMSRINAQVAKAPNNSAFLVLLGGLKLGVKDLAGAEASLQKALELNKKNGEAYLLLGQVQLARGTKDKALATYEQWVKEQPGDDRGFYLLGGLYDGSGDWRKAQELYQKALQLQPENGLAANNLSFSMLEHGGNVELALSHAMAARQNLANSPNAEDTLGWAYYHKGEYKLAISMLERALARMPENASVHYHLGLSYQKMQDTARARRHLQKLLDLDPKHPHAEDARKALQGLG
jgi:tetratricopeptide (TPR) repeat protein